MDEFSRLSLEELAEYYRQLAESEELTIKNKNNE
jgi:hypothetical protein